MSRDQCWKKQFPRCSLLTLISPRRISLEPGILLYQEIKSPHRLWQIYNLEWEYHMGYSEYPALGAMSVPLFCVSLLVPGSQAHLQLSAFQSLLWHRMGMLRSCALCQRPRGLAVHDGPMQTAEADVALSSLCRWSLVHLCLAVLCFPWQCWCQDAMGRSVQSSSLGLLTSTQCSAPQWDLKMEKATLKVVCST